MDIGANIYKHREIKLGTNYLHSHDEYKPDSEVKAACTGKTLLQILVDSSIIPEISQITENSIEADCTCGIIFVFEDGMAEFNYGTMRWADNHIEDFPEVSAVYAESGFLHCFCPLEHYLTLDYRGQTVTNCGFVRPLKDRHYDEQDAEIFGDDMFVSLSGGKTLFLRSGDSEASIRLE